MTPDNLARHIDHTLLRPEATPRDVDALCAQAVAYGFFGVCVNPVYVRRAAARIVELTRDRTRSAPVLVSVAGFPLGATDRRTKADEASRALDDGAREIDMVVNLGALRDGDGATVRADIDDVARVVHRHPSALLKVILEVRALSREQVVLGCRCCAEAQADFVKTSTGMHPSGGPRVEDVVLLYRLVTPIKVKAAGGIRTAADTLAMIRAGAARIGTSAGCEIMDAFRCSEAHSA